jgi:CubicO group peptidase (beta-lactamase class C family)
VVRPRRSVTGDPELALAVRQLCDWKVRRLAACAIDMIGGQSPATSSTAFVKADPGTRFELGSVTKVLTGMLLADAIDRGEVSLATTVKNIHPELTGTEVADVTLLELCTHTSGLPRLPLGPATFARGLLFALFGINPYGNTTPETVLSAAGAQRLRQRGRRSYSNLGAALLGQLLAERAGVDYDVVLADRILVPLAMTSALVADQADRAPRGRSILGVPRAAWPMGGYAPAGGVVATVVDLERLLTGLLDGRAPGCESIEPLSGVATDRPARRTGMFWIRDPAPHDGGALAWHNGATGGYSSFVVLHLESRWAVGVVADTCRPKEQQRIACGIATWLVKRRAVT